MSLDINSFPAEPLDESTALTNSLVEEETLGETLNQRAQIARP